MLLVDEKTEVLMLGTNSLKMDLHHQNQCVPRCVLPPSPLYALPPSFNVPCDVRC